MHVELDLMMQPIGRNCMCFGAAESGGDPNSLYRAPYSQKTFAAS